MSFLSLLTLILLLNDFAICSPDHDVSIHILSPSSGRWKQNIFVELELSIGIGDIADLIRRSPSQFKVCYCGSMEVRCHILNALRADLDSIRIDPPSINNGISVVMAWIQSIYQNVSVHNAIGAKDYKLLWNHEDDAILEVDRLFKLSIQNNEYMSMIDHWDFYQAENDQTTETQEVQRKNIEIKEIDYLLPKSEEFSIFQKNLNINLDTSLEVIRFHRKLLNLLCVSVSAFDWWGCDVIKKGHVMNPFLPLHQRSPKPCLVATYHSRILKTDFRFHFNDEEEEFETYSQRTNRIPSWTDSVSVEAISSSPSILEITSVLKQKPLLQDTRVMIREQFDLEVRFQCYDIGKVNVSIVVDVLSENFIEYSFIKECNIDMNRNSLKFDLPKHVVEIEGSFHLVDSVTENDVELKLDIDHLPDGLLDMEEKYNKETSTVSSYPLWFGLPYSSKFKHVRLKTQFDVLKHSTLFSTAPQLETASSAYGKLYSFAPMIAGKLDTYGYLTEESYYEQYAQSYFGVTAKKGGWDCLRHYEIIASGAVPFFLGIDQLIKQSFVMHVFPKELILEAMRMPGVPTEHSVIKHIEENLPLPSINFNLFNQTRFFEIRKLLLEEIDKKLSTNYLVEYLMKQAYLYHISRHDKQSPFASSSTFTPRVLYVAHNGDDYLNLMIYHGLRSLFGARFSLLTGLSRYNQLNHELGRMNVLYEDDETDNLWGKGFSYHRKLSMPHLLKLTNHNKHHQGGPHQMNETRTDKEADRDSISNIRSELLSKSSELLESILHDRLDKNYFNVIIIPTFGNTCCELKHCLSIDKLNLLNHYIIQNPHVIVMTIDGNDIMGCHNIDQLKTNDLSKVDLHFIREVEKDFSIPDDWNDDWKRSALELKTKVEFVQSPNLWVL